MWDFTWRVSESEEFVGLFTGDDVNELVYVVFFLYPIPQAATEGLFGAHSPL